MRVGPDLSLGGKVAIVTGAGRGIGRAIALRFARCGARVAIAARTAAEIRAVATEIEVGGGLAIAVPTDVARGDEVARLVGETESRFGAVGILVNNAGVLIESPVVSHDDDVWARVLGVNLTGTYLCSKAVLPGMMKRRWGRIVNVSAAAGRVGIANRAAYVASKHGVIGFTRALALEVGPLGIVVNAVCPGLIETEMLRQAIGSNPDRYSGLVRQLPQRRVGTPDQVARLVTFLASDEADGLNGQSIDVASFFMA